MDYYIEPAQQDLEVQEQLNATIPRILSPEGMTLLDPACGSGHNLVEAYDLFKAIYEERGYRSKDIPKLILQKNLFGLEIDDRAAQLAAFALMMKARADYPRFFDVKIQPNVICFVESNGLDAEEIHYALMSPLPAEKQVPEPPRPDGFLFETENNLFTRAEEVKESQAKADITSPKIAKEDIASLIALFENAKTLGALVRVPPKLAEKIPSIAQRLENVLVLGDLTHSAARVLAPLLHQANLLAVQYDAVVANPPYMSSDLYAVNPEGADCHSQKNKRTDLYAVFIQRGLPLVKPTGSLSMITRDSWFFLPTFEKMRLTLLSSATFVSAVHLGPRAFEMISGHVVQTVMFTLMPAQISRHNAVYHRLIDGTHESKRIDLLARQNRHESTQEIFKIIDGSPIAYWLSPPTRRAFQESKQLSEVAEVREGIHTGDNDRYIRYWWEIDFRLFSTNEDSDSTIDAHGKKWIPYNKGGKIRKWYGNNELVIAFDSQTRDEMRKLEGHVRYNQHLYYKEGATWTDVGSGFFCVRYYPKGYLFDGKGMAVVSDDLWLLVGLLNSTACQHFANILMPTLNYKCGSVKKIPYAEPESATLVRNLARSAVELAKASWDSSEVSWDFESVPCHGRLICESIQAMQDEADAKIRLLVDIERQNNQLCIAAYGLDGELAPDVRDEQITVYRPERVEDVKRLLSYAIGCVMGRYSIDCPGLVFAHSKNEGFDLTRYKTFRTDDDGIVPLLESDWGIRDDMVNRIVEFIRVAWPQEHLDENLEFLAESLAPSDGEQPKDTIRRYLATGFYKHHLSMYKKRPIYWLFSSGKQRAFQCLVYLHRYTEGTLARMRTEYVIPLQGMMSARIDQLEEELSKPGSSSHRKKLQKNRSTQKATGRTCHF